MRVLWLAGIGLDLGIREKFVVWLRLEFYMVFIGDCEKSEEK